MLGWSIFWAVVSLLGATGAIIGAIFSWIVWKKWREETDGLAEGRQEIVNNVKTEVKEAEERLRTDINGDLENREKLMDALEGALESLVVTDEMIDKIEGFSAQMAKLPLLISQTAGGALGKQRAMNNKTGDEVYEFMDGMVDDTIQDNLSDMFGKAKGGIIGRALLENPDWAPWVRQYAIDKGFTSLEQDNGGQKPLPAGQQQNFQSSIG